MRRQEKAEHFQQLILLLKAAERLWKTIIITFFVIVFIVCTAQMCSKAPEADVNILIAGPTNFASEPAGTTELESLLSSCLLTDYNGDGHKDAEVRHYMILSEEQIKTLEAVKDENGNPALWVDRSTASSNYSNFYSYLQTGEATIMILDRWAYEDVKSKDLLVDLTTQLNELPEGAIVDEDGRCFGIRLKETALYQEQAAFRVLEEEHIDEDPVICIHYKLVGSDEKRYEVALNVFKSLVG